MARLYPIDNETLQYGLLLPGTEILSDLRFGSALIYQLHIPRPAMTSIINATLIVQKTLRYHLKDALSTELQIITPRLAPFLRLDRHADDLLGYMLGLIEASDCPALENFANDWLNLSLNDTNVCNSFVSANQFNYRSYHIQKYVECSTHFSEWLSKVIKTKVPDWVERNT